MSSIHCHNKSEKHVKQSGTAVLESLRRLLLAPPLPNKQSGIHSAAAAETSSAAALINSISTERAFKRLKHISTTNGDQNIPFIFVFLVPVPECNLINAAGGRKKERKKETKQQIMHEGKGDSAPQTSTQAAHPNRSTKAVLLL